MAGDDIGAAAARRQEGLADNLYPFKLVSSSHIHRDLLMTNKVYDDGTERLACDSARDRGECTFPPMSVCSG
jgi:hypothetical protein